MISFIICLAILVTGYFSYSRVVERVLGPDKRTTPALAVNDGVDYVVLPRWKLFLIQLLNIAGTGPIFGALAGAEWGPVVFLWITFGSIFAGGVHDYFAGMLSERNMGGSISEITGKYLGPQMKFVMRVFSVVLLVLCGTVFAKGPAGLLVTMFQGSGRGGLLVNGTFWLVLILAYYFLAAFLPVDKVIGKFYPIFGLTLIAMAIGVIGGLIYRGYEVPEIWEHFGNMHPDGTPIWAFMFITVACGAVSGFHSTQSPMMARCMESEKQGRFVFFGAMITEGIIALIWAAAGCAVYEVTGGLSTGLASALSNMGQAGTVYDVCKSTLGTVGVPLAMIGVVACPITSGDTAFRSARLTISDWFGLDMGSWKKRFVLTAAILLAGALIAQLDYMIVWRYFSWSNQTLATIVLWAASAYLSREGKRDWVTLIPAVFMSAVTATYFIDAPECLNLPYWLALPVGICFAVGILVFYKYKMAKLKDGSLFLKSGI